MKRTSISIPAVFFITVALAGISCAAVPAAQSGLLSTQMLARQVQALGVPDSDPDKRRRIARGKAVRDHIGDFIVRQLEALPSISNDELEHQLQSIVCGPGLTNSCNDDDDASMPKVFTDGWGPNEEQRQVVVAYMLDLGFMGPGASIVTVENYVWEKASLKARMTTRGGSEFDGYYVQFQKLAWYPFDKQYWIFISGPPIGWSGRAYAGVATLYSVGIDGVRRIWTSGTLPNVRVQTNELGWEVSYADYDRYYGNLPKPYVFDVYNFDYRSRKFQRVIHYRY